MKMTINEVKELQVMVKEELEKEYAKAKENWEELEIVEMPKHYKFFRGETHYSDDIHNIEHYEIKDIIDKYIQELDELPRHISGEKSVDIEFYDEETVSEYRLQYDYQIFNESFDIDARAKIDFKSALKERLKPEGYERVTRDIDCSLLKLFMDEVINWEALQKLVYSDCEL